MKHSCNDCGFTLIELMVALAIMAFGILGFIFLQIRASQGRYAGREMARATIVAQGYCEFLESLDYGSSWLSIGQHPSNSEDSQDGNVDGKMSTRYGNFIYNTSWVVSNNTSRLKTIIVTTRWQLKDNQKGLQTKTLNLTVLKGK
jgi:prepilin-type N-terminal cleavage/methylation domain-containing protein